MQEPYTKMDKVLIILILIILVLFLLEAIVRAYLCVPFWVPHHPRFIC